jgi:hypothetical protein
MLALFRACAAAGLVLVALSGRNFTAAPRFPTARPAADHGGSALATVAEHRYRIIGKLRLALFWVGRDDVGGARMTWRSDGTTSALTLLVGSDPQRAPRGLNQ